MRKLTGVLVLLAAIPVGAKDFTCEQLGAFASRAHVISTHGIPKSDVVKTIKADEGILKAVIDDVYSGKWGTPGIAARRVALECLEKDGDKTRT